MVACPARSLSASPYGAAELKALARAYLSRAIVSGSGLWLAFFVVLVATSPLLWRPASVAHVPCPPPIFVNPNYVPKPPPGLPNSGFRRPNLAGKIPVPTNRPDVTPVERDDGVLAPPTDDPKGTPGVEAPEGTSPFEGPEPSPNDVVLVDEEAIPITVVKPEYPGLARDAGVEGLVIVRALVDRGGHVREAFIDPKHSIPMLDGAALEAARRWVFKPAFTANHPVAVWVAIPMRFALH